MEIEMLDEELKPEFRKRDKYLSAVLDFLDSQQKTLLFKFRTKEETDNCYCTLLSYRRKRNMNIVVWKKNYDVMVIKG